MKVQESVMPEMNYWESLFNILYVTGLSDNTVDYVMVFNILHHINPVEILVEAKRILTQNGKIGVIHWNYDENTLRGQSMNIRLKPETIKKINIGYWILVLI